MGECECMEFESIPITCFFKTLVDLIFEQGKRQNGWNLIFLNGQLLQVMFFSYLCNFLIILVKNGTCACLNINHTFINFSLLLLQHIACYLVK